MITGFNTEFRFSGRVYHVQTEDKGLAHPTIQTLIYVGGEILDSILGDYSDLLKNSSVSEHDVSDGDEIEDLLNDQMELTEELECDISRRMEEQHKQVVSDIKNGKYDFSPNDQAMMQESIFNDRPLLEAILEHLQKDDGTDFLELILNKPLEPKFGSAFKFSMYARLCISKFPIPDAEVSIKLVSSLKTASLLMTGKTDMHGTFEALIDLPSSQPGNCAILVSCVSEYGNDEIRALISV